MYNNTYCKHSIILVQDIFFSNNVDSNNLDCDNSFSRNEIDKKK